MREAITQFVVPLQRGTPASGSAFEQVHSLVVELMGYYKGNDRVSKSLLNDVYVVPRVLAAELEHAPPGERESLNQMIQKLEMCFGLLLLGEVPEDRRPGVPRII